MGKFAMLLALLQSSSISSWVPRLLLLQLTPPEHT
jgi:hypothetical protein